MRPPRSVRFFRTVYADNQARVEARRSLARDAALYLRNRLLQPLERRLVTRFAGSGRPVLFIVGVPRSGTTLLHQLIARHLDVGYVTNRIARYWMAPVWASRRYFPSPSARRSLPLISDLGGTPGEHSPHEFGYFWQFHLEPRDHDEIVESDETRRRLGTVARELEALAGFHGTAVVLKNLNHVDLNVAALARAMPASRFLSIERDPRFVAQSILLARRRRYGDEGAWLSVRFPGYRELLGRDPEEQVVAQIGTVSAAIRAGLSEVPPERRLHLTYEGLVEDPAHWLRRVGERLEVEALDVERLEVTALASGNVARLDPVRLDRLSELVDRGGPAS